MDTDVVVVGAGPVGLTLACELRRHGVDVRVLERHERRPEGSRATDLHARSLELWERTGVAGAILARALPIDAVPLISQGREIARLDFSGVDSPMPAAVSLRQRDLEELLEAHLRDAGGVEVEHGVGVTDVATDPGAERGAVVTDTTGATTNAAYVVACDGVHSGLRERLGIPFRGGEFPGRFAVIDAELADWPFGPGELPVFLDADGLWCMPLPDGRWRVFFRDDDAGDDGPPLDDVQAVLARHVPGARVTGGRDPACFTLHHRVARHYRAGAVFLAGDAAHAMTPVAGQGMNTGIQDACNLAWKLALALDGAPGALLDSYEAERRPVALAAVRASRATHEANALTGAAGRERDLALASALCSPAAVLAAVEAGHELGVAYPHSPIVAGPPGGPAPHPGERVRDAEPLIGPDGATTALRHVLARPALTVLALTAGEDPSAHAATIAAAAQRHGRHVAAAVVAPGAEPPAGLPVDAYADPALRAHGRLGAVHPTLLVVRPDGHLGLRADAGDAEALDAHLRAVCG